MYFKGGWSINKNNIEITGTISSISKENYTTNGKKFIFFDIAQDTKQQDGTYNHTYYSIKLSSDLILRYKEIIKIGNKIYVNGYLTNYIKDGIKHYYIFPNTIKTIDKDFNYEEEVPMISYDTDGVMLWHGKRCESIPPTEEELKEMEDLLSEFR